jgi:hypothetical protein
VDDERGYAGDDDSDVIEWREAGGAREAKQFPRGKRRRYGEERRERRSSIYHDGDRDRSRDHPEDNAACEL